MTCELMPVADARARILADLQAMPAEPAVLTEAHGRVLAEDVAARTTQPPLAVSAMDGYAVRAADVASVPVALNVVGAVPAGGQHEGTIGPGEAVRIFTGAPLPDGADTIVIQEDTERDGDTVTVNEGAAEGRYVRKAGLDFAEGDVLLRAGTTLSARDIGLAAAMDHPWLKVSRRPRVALLATGDEIFLPGERRGPTGIVSSNTFALEGLVRAAGGEPVTLGIAPDDRAAISAMAEGARDMDMLVTTGGASVGEHDLVRDALGDIGLELDFWQIAMRPGKPLMFGRLGDVPMLGFPGNPVSSTVCGVLFLAPALAQMLGTGQTEPVRETAVLGVDLKENDRREDYLRSELAREGDRLVATPFSLQDSSNFARLTRADCLVIRPPQAPAAKSGDPVEFIRLGDGSIRI
ncbi:MAG: molybdopterin molybdenumtransferase MoeA [Alphaproteobacteria bacterium]|nr:molybdopterin molybdenumtransferase MoeA [Alphaproteobacteria bacterium]